jgi:hypothetical protein
MLSRNRQRKNQLRWGIAWGVREVRVQRTHLITIMDYEHCSFTRLPSSLARTVKVIMQSQWFQSRAHLFADGWRLSRHDNIDNTRIPMAVSILVELRITTGLVEKSSRSWCECTRFERWWPQLGVDATLISSSIHIINQVPVTVPMFSGPKTQLGWCKYCPDEWQIENNSLTP